MCILCTALALLLLSSAVREAWPVPAGGPGSESRWSGRWETAAPAGLGFDPARLEGAVERIGQLEGLYGLIVVRGGSIAAERYFREAFREKPHNLKSASKVVISTLVGIAADEGLLDIDRPIAAWLPYGDLFEDPRRAAVTVRHLLTMTSGLEPTSYQTYNAWISRKDWVRAALERPMAAEPGTVFQYSTGDTHILSGVLDVVTGGTRDFAEKHLFGPMDIRLQGWDEDPSGVPLGGNNLSLLPRDMAKIGLLYLDGGVFGDRRIVSRGWIEDAVRPNALGDHEVYGAYGYLWYTRPGGREAFAAVGYGGQYIYVAPPEDCVVVVTSTLESKGLPWETELFQRIQEGVLGSLRPDAPDLAPRHRLRVPPAAGEDLPGRMASVVPVEGSGATLPIARGRTLANLVLRSAPGTEGVRLGLVPLDTEVSILETKDRWHRIRHRRQPGWISGEYVRVIAGEPKEAPAGETAPVRVAEATMPSRQPREAPGEEKAAAEAASASMPEFARMQIEALTRALESAESVRKSKDARLEALQHERDDLAAAVAAKESRNRELAGQLAAAWDEVAALEEQSRKAEAGASRSREALRDKAAEAQDLRSQLMDRRKALDAAMDDQQRLEAALAAAETERAAREEQLAAAIERLRSLKADLDGSRERVAELERLSQAGDERTHRLNEALQAADEERKRLAADNALLRDTLSGVRREAAAGAGETERLQAELARLREEAFAAQQKAEAAAVEILGLSSEMKAVQSGREEAVQRADSLSRQLSEVQEVLAAEREGFARREQQLQHEAAALAEQVRGREASEARLQQEKEALTADLAAAASDAARLREVSAALEAERTERLRRLASLEPAAAETRKEAERLEAALDEVEAGSAEKSNRVNALEERISGLQQDVQRLEAALSNAEKERRLLSGEAASLREELAARRSSVEAFADERERLREELNRLRGTVELQQKQAESEAAERSRLVSELTAARDALAAERESSAEQREAIQGQLAAVEEELRQRRGEGRWMVSAVERLTTELTEARRELEVLTSRITEPPPVVPSAAAQGTAPEAETPVPADAPRQTTAASRPGPSEASPPEAPAPVSPPTEAGDAAALPEVGRFVNSWADAWSRKDADAYLARYSERFQPDRGRTLEAWRNIRRRRLAKPKFIEVTVQDLTVERPSSETAVAEFLQSYRSETYADEVHKRLELVFEDGGWKILSEASGPAR